MSKDFDIHLKRVRGVGKFATDFSSSACTELERDLGSAASKLAAMRTEFARQLAVSKAENQSLLSENQVLRGRVQSMSEDLWNQETLSLQQMVKHKEFLVKNKANLEDLKRSSSLISSLIQRHPGIHNDSASSSGQTGPETGQPRGSDIVHKDMPLGSDEPKGDLRWCCDGSDITARDLPSTTAGSSRIDGFSVPLAPPANLSVDYGSSSGHNGTESGPALFCSGATNSGCQEHVKVAFDPKQW